MLADDDCYSGKMSVESDYVVAMVEHDLAAVSGVHAGYGHVAISRCAHLRAEGRINVDALMKSTFAVEWIYALAKALSHAALQRPERGRVGQFRPVSRITGREAAL
jgi:hypothetical protein